jgi:phage major head subunit gpT-like protein
VAISNDIQSIYTVAMNGAFLNGYDAIAETPPIQQALTIVPSKSKVETYPWMFPPPLMHEWQGYRNYAQLGETKYRVPNVTYTAEFKALEEDITDDQVGGFKLQAAALGRGAKEWQYIQPQVTLAAGQTTTCFDGSNFFASSHTVGTGDNIVTGTGSGSAATHAMVVLITSNRSVKPLLWQSREGPDFRSDIGSIEADKAREVRWWADMRGAAAFGFWWDAVLVKWTATPTVSDMLTTLATVNGRLRTFKYPKNLASDVNQYIHGQTSFTKSNVLIVCSSLIENTVRQALTLSLISQTENYFMNWASLTCSGYLDDVT